MIIWPGPEIDQKISQAQRSEEEQQDE